MGKLITTGKQEHFLIMKDWQWPCKAPQSVNTDDTNI